MYITITIVVFIILIACAIYGWVREELKVTKLKEFNKKTVESLERQNLKLQQKIIILENDKKKLKITIDVNNKQE